MFWHERILVSGWARGDSFKQATDERRAFRHNDAVRVGVRASSASSGANSATCCGENDVANP